ncbi:MAG: IPT/TIG domain-containing protein [Polyangiales bacterium]
MSSHITIFRFVAAGVTDLEPCRLGRAPVATFTLTVLMLAQLCAALTGCSSGGDAYQPPALGDKPAAADSGTSENGNDNPPEFPVTGINSGRLTITAVEPGTGPFSGGTTAVVRGSGFDDTVTIHIGGVQVQPGEMTRDDKNRITFVVPAGRVGPADVEVTQNGQTVTLRDGFIYNGLAVSPANGAASGGSLVDLTASGATFADDTVVEFGGTACVELQLLSPQSARCKTPAHDVGVVDVIARSPSQSSPPLLAKNGYEFAETLNVEGGGLSGGPIAGTLNVTVISDGAVGAVIPNALVMLGNDPRSARKGKTDARGSVTFSEVDLKGPITLHATAKCFQRASIVEFDASEVTIFLPPAIDPSCSAEGEIGSGVKQLASTVSGELIFPGREEFSVNTWDIIPQPKANEIRVAYVFTTQASLDARRIAPEGTSAELARLVEGNATPGKRGFIFRITSRPAGLAIFALAGLERVDTREFIPYVMGVAHDVVTSPGEETKDVQVPMTITLDRELAVSLSGLPAPTPDGPDELRVRAYVDLGAEGLIIRDVNSVPLDELLRHTSAEPFRFLGQPAFVGGLSDASYYVLAGYYTSPPDSGPFTRQKRTGVLPGEPLHFDGFLGIPTLVAPATGARIPDDRILRFELQGPTPDMIVVDIYGGDGFPVWTEILPGHVREIPIPDLSLVEGYSDIASGYVRWVVTAVKIDDFRYNEFQYTYVTSRYWTHDAANVFVSRR